MKSTFKRDEKESLEDGRLDISLEPPAEESLETPAEESLEPQCYWLRVFQSNLQMRYIILYTFVYIYILAILWKTICFFNEHIFLEGKVSQIF